MYEVPIAEPALSPSGGGVILLPTCNVGIAYDVGGEYPNDPYRALVAWANAYWIVTSVYNGK